MSQGIWSTWYVISSLIEDKANPSIDVLLNYVEGMHTTASSVSRILPFATEASWATGRWQTLEKYTSMATEDIGEDFNVNVGSALLSLYRKDIAGFTSTVNSVREQIASSMSMVSSLSIGACHDTMLKFHVLTELEIIAGTDSPEVENGQIIESLNRRLAVLGAYLNDKQYLLGIRRAALQLSRYVYSIPDP